jgi:hypothetical protein
MTIINFIMNETIALINLIININFKRYFEDKLKVMYYFRTN